MNASEDRFLRYDAAYVLGALTPSDRREYETHLAGCTACAASVAELAGVPGLLGRVQADRVAESVPDAGPVPGTLLPRLMAASRAERRHRRVRVAVAGGLAAAVITVAVVLGTVLLPAGPDHAPLAGRAVSMSAVRSAPVDATLRLERVAWGTKVHVRCTYVAQVGAYGPADRTVYRLVAVARDDGREQTVAQWAVLPGQDATLEGSTDLTPDEIGRLQLETLDGTVLLETGLRRG